MQVANAQLEALRLENRHLRKTALRQAQGEADLEEAEGHLQELQNAYVTSLSALEVGHVWGSQLYFIIIK